MDIRMQPHICRSYYFHIEMIKKVKSRCIYIGSPVDKKLKLRSGICILGEECKCDNLLEHIDHQISSFLASEAKKINYHSRTSHTKI